jgi:pimeloyl-ACP methyl ester carboxylesterase
VTTFCLVHGAWHGGWCWDRLAPELEARGGKVVAPDLPCEDVDAGVSVYADVVDAALGDAGDVILVGHSLGGATIPLVAARRPVRALVYLCALVPTPGEPISRAIADGALLPGFAGSTVKDELGRTYWPDPAAAVHDLFHDAPPAAAVDAAARLRRQARAASREPCPLDELPDMERICVVCRDDRAVSASWSRTAARDLLGVEPVELPGSHSPFLSRPAELAELLFSLA